MKRPSKPATITPHLANDTPLDHTLLILLVIIVRTFFLAVCASSVEHATVIMAQRFFSSPRHKLKRDYILPTVIVYQTWTFCVPILTHVLT